MSEFLFTRSPLSTCQCWINYAESGSYFWSFLCTKPTMTFGKKTMRLQLPLVKLVKKFCFTFSRVDTKCQSVLKECMNVTATSLKYIYYKGVLSWKVVCEKVNCIEIKKKKSIQIFLWIGQNELPINTQLICNSSEILDILRLCNLHLIITMICMPS